MTYPVHVIESKEKLDHCPVFQVNHYLWDSLRQPETFGQMAYLDGRGLFLRMTCMEQDPKREFQNHRDMVCKDSAMEAFFAFPDPNLRQTPPPSNDCLYLNFEINANGAMYAKYGPGRQGRQFITDEEYALTGAKAAIESDRWTAELLIPDPLLERLGLPKFKVKDTFFCNFYKIAEDPAILHFGAYHPIPVEKPNFHLPAHFARAEIVAPGKNTIS